MITEAGGCLGDASSHLYTLLSLLSGAGARCVISVKQINL